MYKKLQSSQENRCRTSPYVEFIILCTACKGTETQDCLFVYFLHFRIQIQYV